ncbi:MAG: fibronectin type III domain-containing protein [Bryobacterales bacterium]|nr:fibronectin type III domain-containing protein [Bryobacterales bacterium]
MSRTSAATFTVTPAPTSPLTVRLWVTESGGFLPPGGWAGHEVTVPTGGSATFSVPTVNDNLEGRTGRVSLRVEVGDGYSLDNMNWQARVTVNDNDGPGGRTPGIPSVPAVPATRPDAPGRLRAVPADGAVTLSWDAPRDDGGARITDYEYQINGEGEWISIGSANLIHTITGLTNGRAYVFRVRAVNRVGRSEASNRVKAIAGAVLDLAHFANGTGITSEFVFLNVSPHLTRPALYFYDQGGALMDPASVVEVAGDLMVTEDGGLTVHAEMEPLGQLTIRTHGRGDLLSGSVRVASGVPIGGLARYSVPGVGVAAVAASPPVRDVVFPARRQEGGVRTAAALHNLEEEALGVNCRLMSGGVEMEEVEIPLEANGQASWYLEDAFSTTDTSDFLGSVHCTVRGYRRVTAIAVETDAAQRTFTALPVAAVDRTGGSGGETVLDFAHFANGTWTTDLVFVNLSIEASGRPPLPPLHPAILPSRPVIYFHDTEGALVPPASVVDITGDLEVTEDGALTVRSEMEPLGVLTISTHGRGELLTGSVRVVSEGPIGGMLRFEHPALGVTGAAASQPVSDVIFPVQRQEGGINTGVALHNLESSSGLLRCELLREGLPLDSVSIPLEANA